MVAKHPNAGGATLQICAVRCRTPLKARRACAPSASQVPGPDPEPSRRTAAAGPAVLASRWAAGPAKNACAWMRDPLAVPDGELITHSPRVAVLSKPYQTATGRHLYIRIGRARLGGRPPSSDGAAAEPVRRSDIAPLLESRFRDVAPDEAL
jgi:hypothetical protein